MADSEICVFLRFAFISFITLHFFICLYPSLHFTLDLRCRSWFRSYILKTGPLGDRVSAKSRKIWMFYRHLFSKFFEAEKQSPQTFWLLFAALAEVKLCSKTLLKILSPQYWPSKGWLQHNGQTGCIYLVKVESYFRTRRNANVERSHPDSASYCFLSSELNS